MSQTRKGFLILLAVALASFKINAQQLSKVHLHNGETLEGRIVAITDSSLILNSNDSAVRLSRTDISYVFPAGRYRAPSAKRSREPVPKIEVGPITKRWISEFEAGLTFGNPFACRVGYKEWLRAGNHFQFGLGSSMQFYRFTMLNVNLSSRVLLGGHDYFKPFIEGEYGLSFFENITQVNLNNLGFISDYPFDFGPVRQANIGFGLWTDTSLGVAFTTKITWNGTWYHLDEYQREDRLTSGDYFISSAMISGSFIF